MLVRSMMPRLENKRVKVYLKDGTCLEGILEHSDLFMNVLLRDIVDKDECDMGYLAGLKKMFIRGVKLGFIEFDDEQLDAEMLSETF